MCSLRGQTKRCKPPEWHFEVHLHFAESSRVQMELRSGKVLFNISPETMSGVTATSKEEEKLIPPAASTSVIAGTTSYYARLQALTRGYLWFCLALSVLIIATAIVFFPQTLWNRMMMSLFGCITFTVRGKPYKLCGQQQVPENAGIPL